MKKLSILFAIFVSSLALALCSCAKNENSGGSNDNLPEISDLIIYENDVEVVLGDVLAVRATDGKDSVKCSWKSSDETIATVDEWGNVTAENVGDVTITATYGKLAATCAVSVTLGGNLPFIETEADENVTVDLMHKIGIGGKVCFNGKTVDGGKITYTVADESIGKVENGVFKPLKKGETTVTVTGEWKNLQSPFMTAKVNVKVIDNVSLLLNGESVPSEVSLYATDELNGKSYDNEFLADISLTVNGVSKNITLEVEDDDVAIYDATDKKVIARKSGETTLRICSADEDFEFESEINLTVISPIADYSAKITGFSALDGEMIDENGLDVLNKYFGEDNPVVSATQNGKSLDISQNGKILGVETVGTGLTTTRISVVGSKFGYNFDAEGYTKIIKTAKDLSVFNISSKGTKIVGTYLLNNDIDINNLAEGDSFEEANTGGWSVFESSWLEGTFDGNGHKINGFPMNDKGNSLFGRIENFTIKNLALTNVVINGWNSRLISFLAGFSKPVTIENVYISVVVGDMSSSKYARKSSFCLIGDRQSTYQTIKNVAVSYSASSNILVTGGSGQGVGFFRYDNGAVAKTSNVYMLAPAANNGRILPVFQSTTQTVYAENDFKELSDGSKVAFDDTTKNPKASADGTNTVYHLAGVYRYDSAEALTEAGITKVGNWKVSKSGVEWEA